MSIKHIHLNTNIKPLQIPHNTNYIWKIDAAISADAPHGRLDQTKTSINHLFIKIVSKIKSLRNFSNAAPTSLQP